MSPDAPHSLVLEVLKALARDPLEESEVAELYNPAYLWNVFPEEALNLDPDGLPMWWPKRHPETLRPLSKARRLRWCVEVLAGGPGLWREQLVNGDERSRKRIVARSLLHLYPEWTSGPIPTHGL